MKKTKTVCVHRALKKLALALLISGTAAAGAQAGETPVTQSIQGRAPMVKAPSNGAESAVDFDWAGANPAQLSTGDTITMKWLFVDDDDDEGNTWSTVVWSYIKPGGEKVVIPAQNAPSRDGQPGTSVIVIPAAAAGALAIYVELTEESVTGNPRTGKKIVIQDTSLSTDPTGPGGGGDLVTPPGPILAGTGQITGGIFLASDSPTAGSGSTDYTRNNLSPKTGETYVFRAWVDTNGNGVWDEGEEEITASLNSIQWMLDGSNATAAGGTSTVVLSNQAILGATTDSYTVPANAGSSSGAAAGDQGFGLKVDFR
ncbi:ornithine carbamoyltransferase [Serratia fonticola]|uniref:SinI family autotransporter-associated protein n=1 Tax=Serratia fonticola TaxID=47917 RepID=UPI0015C61141|nr:SinI family autotransporter-associated protein [Serratia fonticola]MBC3381137.1 ornithine carbamoyltransferase [Serratia fonticola]NYA40336.1 ornithine carbamoyltransferase [Serratia fonticola]